jgi:hypothetical protein
MKQYLEYVEFQARPCWNLCENLGGDRDIISMPFEELDPEADPPDFYTVYGTFLDGTQHAHFDLECETQARELATALNELLAMHAAMRVCRNAFDYITRALNHKRTDIAQAHATTAIAVTELQLDAFDR